MHRHAVGVSVTRKGMQSVCDCDVHRNVHFTSSQGSLSEAALVAVPSSNPT